MTGPTTLFVYGTLMPGHLRWPMLAPHATASRSTSVAGRLYDSGHGWPVARLIDDGLGPDDVVPGWAVELRADGLDALLRVLDEMEGVDRGLYDRVVVRLADGADAWAYSMGTEVRTLPRIAAWEGRPEA